MKRLTTKGQYSEPYDYKSGTVCINKLGQLEDIENELGIDLITFYKALTNGFYIDKKQVEKEPAWEDMEEKITHINCPKYFRFNLWYKTIEVDRFGNYLEIWLKDYGKTWALTKEELG